MKKTCLGYTRVEDVNGLRKDYQTVGLTMDKKHAIELAKNLIKVARRKNDKSKKVVLTVFKNRVNEDGMRTIVSGR